MKSLTVVYNKNQEEEPIKSSQSPTHIEVDNRNNVYVSIGSQIRVFSLRRLSKQKDFLMDIIKMQKVMEDRKGLEPDALTKRFNDQDTGLMELKEYLVQEENRLMNPRVFNDRVRFLNQQNMFVKHFSVSTHMVLRPNINVLLATGHMVVLKDRNNKYERVSKCIHKDVRASKYIGNDAIAIVGQQLLIVSDESDQVLFRCTMKERVNMIESISSGDQTKLVMSTMNKVLVYVFRKMKKVSETEILVDKCVDFLQASYGFNSLMYVGSFANWYSLDLNQQKLQLKKHGEVSDQRVLLHDDQTIHTSKKYKENALTKLLVQTGSGLYVSFSSDIGSTFKQLSMMVSSPNEYALLKRCMIKIQKFRSKESSHPLNFHDLRMLQNKPLLVELQRIALILNDNALTFVGKTGKEKKINKDILDASLESIDSLHILQQHLPILTEKLLIHVLLCSGESKKATLHSLIAEIVKQRVDSPFIKAEPALVWKRCMFNYEELGDGDLLECIQCKLLGNKDKNPSETVCYACWGELKVIEAS